MPLEEKMRFTLKDAEVNQGYTPDGAEANEGAGTDHKEVWFRAGWMGYMDGRIDADSCLTVL
jgi:hypothetical protein